MAIKRIIPAVLAMSVVLSASLLVSSAAEPEKTVSLPILMYHHISTDPERWGDYTVSPEMLRGDLAYLKEQGYTTITLQELTAYANGQGTLPEKPIMITFDDGQESFLVYGLPLFEEYQMNAVLAIIGRCADVYTENGDNNVNYGYLSWPDLAALEASPYVELAAHTYDMHSEKTRKGCRRMSGESMDAYRLAFGQDMGLLESRFENQLGFLPSAFAYPFGYRCEEAKQLLTERGYSILFTCNQKVNQLHGEASELLTLGRFNRPYGMAREDYFRQLAI